MRRKIMKKSVTTIAVLGLFGLVIVGCTEMFEPVSSKVVTVDDEIAALEAASKNAIHYCPPPSPLVNVSAGEDELTFWPYVGNNFSGEAHDPINLIFIGEADPRDIRAALLALDGDRTAFGYDPIPPFNLTWDDAIGFMMTTYGEPEGWTAGCIQLCCGDYQEPRFHIRLFKVGPYTMANVHFEVLIPGTADHQVLSWEVAEEFVMVDFIRSGLLDPDVPMIPTQQINDSPFRTIPDYIYNELPVEVRAYIGGPLEDIVGETGIGTDGHAMILNLAGTAGRVAEVRVKDFILNYGQMVPKPFCSSGPMDFLYVQGPVQMTMTTTLSSTGQYDMIFQAMGELTATPFDPVNKVPIGEPIPTLVKERYVSVFGDDHWSGTSMQYQKLIPPSSEGGGRLFTWLHIKSSGGNGYRAEVWCGPEGPAFEATPKEAAGLLVPWQQVER
jgi:hypothetical protein